MNKTFVRVMGLLLALFIIAGLAIPAFAASSLSIESVEGAKYLTGRPNTSEKAFDSVGLYRFKLHTIDGKLQASVVRPGAGVEEKEPGSDKIKYYGNTQFSNEQFVIWDAIFKKIDNTPWENDDVFYVTIADEYGNNAQENAHDGSIETVSITTTGGSTPSNIYKNGRVNAKFRIVDSYGVHGKAQNISVVYNADAFVSSTAKNKVELVSGVSETGAATFDVTLEDLKYTGKGNMIRFSILYDMDGQRKIVNVSYAVPNCKEDTSSNNNNNDNDNDKEIDPLTPYIIVESYTYGGTSVNAGNEFKLRLMLRNTSSTHTLQNIKMSVSPKGVFSMTSSSNTFYIDSLMAGSTLEKEITLYAGLTSVTDSKDANSIGIDFDFQYVANDVRKSGTSNENITIPVFFPDRFEYTEPSYPKEVYMGEEFSLYVPFVNKGRSTIYNLSAELVGAKATQDQKIYLGNINAGTENSIEFYINPEEPGEINGQILLSYEDANMNLIEKVISFNTTVQEPFIPDMGEPEFPIGGEEIPTDGNVETKGNNKNLLLGLSFVIIAAMSGYITVEKIKRKRSEFDDETI